MPHRHNQPNRWPEQIGVPPDGTLTVRPAAQPAEVAPAPTPAATEAPTVPQAPLPDPVWEALNKPSTVKRRGRPPGSKNKPKPVQ